jgi:transposase
MLTYKSLSAKPGAFRSMTGVSVKEFEDLLARVRPRYEALLSKRTFRPERRRGPGGGLKSRHDLTERLLMTLVWLKLYVTCEALGVMFEVDKSTASRFTRPILQILRELGEDTLGWPEEARALAEPTEPEEGVPSDAPDQAAQSDRDGEDGEEAAGDQRVLLDDDPIEGEVRLVTPDRSDCPDHLAILDATEQRTRRSADYATQKRYYSGKKKCHTIKTQIIVNERGRIRHVADSVPGSTHDLTLLRESGVTTDLPEGLTVTADTGYRGAQNDFPEHSVALPYRRKSKQALTPEEKLHNNLVSKVRIVVENALCELKHFRALSSVFRHSLDIYNQITRAVAGIVNWRFDKRTAEVPA